MTRAPLLDDDEQHALSDFWRYWHPVGDGPRVGWRPGAAPSEFDLLFWLLQLAGRSWPDPHPVASVALDNDYERALDRLRQLGGSAVDYARRTDLAVTERAVWTWAAPALDIDDETDFETQAPRTIHTTYEPGIHDLALTEDECERILATMGADNGGSDRYGLAYHPVTDSDVLERVQQIVEHVRATWWRFPNAIAGGVHVKGYAAGDDCTLHYDRPPFAPDICAVIGVCLSDVDEYAGGQFRLLSPAGLPNGYVNVPMRKGAVVVYDASTPHEVTTVTAGERFALIAPIYSGVLA